MKAPRPQAPAAPTAESDTPAASGPGSAFGSGSPASLRDVSATTRPPAPEPDSSADTDPDSEAAAQARLDATRRERLEMAQRKEEIKAIKMRKELDALEAMVAKDDGDDDDGPLRPAAPTGKPEPEPIIAAPPVGKARAKRRHWGALISFAVMAIVPVMVCVWYLNQRAAPRYVSLAGFSVRTEEVGSSIELLGQVAQMSGSSSSDTDILYQFIQSQELVRKADAVLDLRALWAKGDPDTDFVFAYHPPGTIEDLVTYWGRMVGVYSDSGTGLIDLEVQAFTPEDATRIAQFIYDESTLMINRLSAIARDDATGYAREELESSVEELKIARAALTRFRNETQIVDPAASIQSQMGILSSLQGQLAQTLIDLDILMQTTSASDPRVVQIRRRVEVIEARIAEERKKLGIGVRGETGTDVPEGEAFADLVGEYERLLVDQQFAGESYTAARATYESSLAEARRQSRYLAAHVHPTTAESARYPQFYQTSGLVMLFSFLAWALIVMIGYALRDRR